MTDMQQTRAAAREILGCYIEWHAGRQAGASPGPGTLAALLAGCPVLAPAELPPHLAARLAEALADVAAEFTSELYQRAGVHLRAAWFDFCHDSASSPMTG